MMVLSVNLHNYNTHYIIYIIHNTHYIHNYLHSYTCMIIALHLLQELLYLCLSLRLRHKIDIMDPAVFQIRINDLAWSRVTEVSELCDKLLNGGFG